MNFFCVLALTSAAFVFGCAGQKDANPLAPQPNDERVETLANFLQVKAQDLADYIDDSSDDAVVLSAIVQYNETNDVLVIENTINRIQDADLKKQLTVLLGALK
ncbi:MAG: hypothetical protein LBD58_07305 [Treponema sp.]|jgi:hypothetical protein|nr:hypothetical protein [Treponema sp.]